MTCLAVLTRAARALLCCHHLSKPASCHLADDTVAMQVARLNKQKLDCTPKIGDVLRAVTCTNFVYPTKALFGAVPPQRHIVGGQLQTVPAFGMLLSAAAVHAAVRFMCS